MQDTGKLAAVHLRNLVRVEGEGAGPTAVPGRSAGWKPAQNITFRGIGFRDAGWTVLAPHGAPSGVYMYCHYHHNYFLLRLCSLRR